jgi:hypothetical protein
MARRFAQAQAIDSQEGDRASASRRDHNRVYRSWAFLHVPARIGLTTNALKFVGWKRFAMPPNPGPWSAVTRTWAIRGVSFTTSIIRPSSCTSRVLTGNTSWYGRASNAPRRRRSWQWPLTSLLRGCRHTSAARVDHVRRRATKRCSSARVPSDAAVRGAKNFWNAAEAEPRLGSPQGIPSPCE